MYVSPASIYTLLFALMTAAFVCLEPAKAEIVLDPQNGLEATGYPFYFYFKLPTDTKNGFTETQLLIIESVLIASWNDDPVNDGNHIKALSIDTIDHDQLYGSGVREIECSEIVLGGESGDRKLTKRGGKSGGGRGNKNGDGNGGDDGGGEPDYPDIYPFLPYPCMYDHEEIWEDSICDIVFIWQQEVCLMLGQYDVFEYLDVEACMNIVDFSAYLLPGCQPFEGGSNVAAQVLLEE